LKLCYGQRDEVLNAYRKELFAAKQSKVESEGTLPLTDKDIFQSVTPTTDPLPVLTTSTAIDAMSDTKASTTRITTSTGSVMDSDMVTINQDKILKIMHTIHSICP
jgi:hypothetical protein